MKLRVGLLDIAGAGVVLFALVLPAASKKVQPIYEGKQAELVPEILAAQATLARDERDLIALTRYVDLLSLAGQTDQALRAAGAAYAVEAPGRWRAALATSSIHADRLDAKEAHEWAEKALVACDAPGAECPTHERVRVDLYARALKAGIDSGLDPKVDPEGFKHAIDAAIPMIRVGGRRNRPPM